MQKILNRIALAVAGLGLITGAASASTPALLHEEVRHRIISEVGVEEVSPDVLREALGKEPFFELLLEFFLERSATVYPRSSLADDAFQETMLKIWKGQPRIFLKPYDEVVRYLQTATKHNLITEFNKERTRKGKEQQGPAGTEVSARTLSGDPLAEAAAGDLYDRLASVIVEDDVAVLDAYLAGTRSQRQIAETLGVSRYAVNRSTENIQQALLTLLPGKDSSPG